MKLVNFVLCIVLAAALAACGGSGGGSSGGGNPTPTSVGIRCFDFYNDGQNDDCQNPQAGGTMVTSATTLISLGTIDRSSMVEITAIISNPTGSVFNGKLDITVDFGCAGDTTWNIINKQAISVPAGGTFTKTTFGQCGDASPLGSRQIIATVYESDGTTEVDRVVGQFTLVE